MKDEIEIWKPIMGYEGLYEVSNIGRIRSFCSNNNYRYKNQPIPIILKPSRVKGYSHIMLYKNNTQRRYRVHRLLLEAFVGPCSPGFYACHHDDDRTNNKLGNLKWGSPKENGQDAKRNNKMPSGTKVKCALPDNLIENMFKLSADGHSTYMISKILKVAKRSVFLNLDGKTTRGKILLEIYKKSGIPIKTLTKRCSREAENNPSAKLNWEIVREIRTLYKTGNYSQQFLASKYKMGKNTVGMIVRNESWLETETSRM